jgi:hypothetical protein
MATTIKAVTTWTRLEPLPRSADLDLEARIADPLWMMARQWQLGEFRGEDTGSPIRADLTAEIAHMHRFHAGKLRRQAEGRSVDYRDEDLPLEVMVEREVPLLGERWAADSGQQFLRYLKEHRAKAVANDYVDAFGFGEPETAGDHTVRTIREFAAGRVPHGIALFESLTSHRGAAALLTSLPAEPVIPAGVRSKVIEAANAWLHWYEHVYVAPEGNDAWNPERMEYAFGVSAVLDRDEIVLAADEYTDGTLDWYTFTAGNSPRLGRPAVAQPNETVKRTVIPAPVTYGGMPAQRYWEFEDGSVNLGALDAGPSDLARLLLVEFALAYGDDWFVLPIEMPVGSVAKITELKITDTFGVITTVGPAADTSGTPWQMFELTGDARHQDLFLLPPTLATRMESEPLEQVAFFRDEIANMVWGVERVVQSASGDVVDRYEEYQQALGAGEFQRVDGEIGDAELMYRLSTIVPPHWIPFVPVKKAPTGIGSFAIQLERRAMLRVKADGSTTLIQPRGTILTPGRRLRIEEEEIDRGGAIVERSYQYTRWVDGRSYLWMGRRKRSGRGEGSSGLRFDIAEPPQTAAT